jgi:hypothetical protein
MPSQYLGDLALNGYASAPSGTVRFYQPGTLTPVTVYSNDAATTAITQPVQLDAAGKSTVPVYLTAPARMIVQSAAGATLVDIERVDGLRAETTALVNPLWPNSASLNALATNLATSLGGTDGNFKAIGSGGVNRGVAAKLSEAISVKDFGAKGDGITDDTSAITAALVYAAAQSGGSVLFPAGTYLISQTLTNNANNIALVGAGRTASIIKNSSTTGDAITMANVTSVTLDSIGISASSTSTGAALRLTGASCDSISLNRVGMSGHRTGIGGAGAVIGTGGISIRECNIVCDNNAASVCISVVAQLLNVFAGFYDIGGTTAGSVCLLNDSSSGINALTSVFGGWWRGNVVFKHTDTGSVNYLHVFGAFPNSSGSISVGTAAIVMAFANFQSATSIPGMFLVSPNAGRWGDSGPLLSTSIATTSAYTPSMIATQDHLINGTAAGITITVNAPTSAVAPLPNGSRVTLLLANTSGGAVAWAFDATYRVAAVAPATGTFVSITCVYVSATATWREISRSSAATF